MQYEFPVIRTFADVVDAIRGYDEIIVAEKDGYRVVNYVVAGPETFSMENGGEIRRECRGLIFDTEGRLISRPFHKFFNVGERLETHPENLDLARAHVIMDKLDGSMIRPFILEGNLHLGTKMGITDVSLQAEKWLKANDASGEKWQWMFDVCVAGWTPLFEWISPSNQIVLPYKESDLVLLGMRDNLTGEYASRDILERSPFTLVGVHESKTSSAREFAEKVALEEDVEGYIIQDITTGHMVKLKCSWYVSIHKTLERVAYDRNIVDLILSESLDDALSLLPVAKQEYINDFEARFWKAVNRKYVHLTTIIGKAIKDYEGDKKRIALELVPTIDKADAPFIFRVIDGNELRPLLLEKISNNVSRNTKWEECAKWLTME